MVNVRMFSMKSSLVTHLTWLAAALNRSRQHLCPCTVAPNVIFVRAQGFLYLRSSLDLALEVYIKCTNSW